MADACEKRLERAGMFLKRASGSSDLEQKLLCLYDGFVCLYGPVDACSRAASCAGVEGVFLRSAIDTCLGDGDGDSPSARTEVSEEFVGKLYVALESAIRNYM